MKTCPVCGETYSERIDFCFNEGAALVLNPSAIDAPMPRAAQSGAVPTLSAPTAPRRTSPPVESAPPSAARSAADSAPTAVVARPVAEIVPAAAEETDPSLRLDAPPRRPVPPPPPPQPSGPTEVPRVAETNDDPFFDTSPTDPFASGGVDTIDDDLDGYRRRAAPVWWPFAAAVGVFVVLLLIWLNSGAGEPTAPPPEVAAERAPEPVAPPEPLDPEVAEPGPSDSAPEPAEAGELVEADAPIEAAPEPAEAPPADVAPTPVVTAPPRPAPAPRPPAATPSPAPVTPKPAPAVAKAAPASSGSPWDLPSAATAEATATFSSDPPGALLRVDGVLRGKTPVEVALPFGEHLVELELDGYRPVAKSVQVASANPKYPHTLVPQYRTGNVLITAPGWEGAQLFVDGAPQGRIPTQVLLREGNHSFELRRGDQARTTERRVSIDPSGVSRINLAE